MEGLVSSGVRDKNGSSFNTISQHTPKDNEKESVEVLSADLHYDEVVEAARNGGVDVVLTIYELEKYMDAQDRREEAYNEF